jgi:hypothetical protein
LSGAKGYFAEAKRVDFNVEEKTLKHIKIRKGILMKNMNKFITIKEK